jgi:steroid delta-isomerase-like uncharacterized protein
MNRYLPVLLAFLVGAGTCQADAADNIGAVRGMIAAINDRDLAALGRYVAPDLVRHSAATPDVKVTSLDEFRAFLKDDFSAVPDSVQEIDVIFGTEEYVAVRARYIGTQTGPMGPFPPSGKGLELPYLGIVRLENGKIVEMWVEWDNLSALTQLGHWPPRAGPGGPR